MRSVARLDVVNGADDARRRRRRGRLPARPAPAASAPALASLRPDQLTLFGAMSPRAGARAVPADDVPAARRSEHVSEVLLGARRARRARRRRRLDRRHHRRRDADRRHRRCSAASPSPASALAESETIVVRVALDVLPTLLGVLLLAGAAAIIVSTANSMLLTPATNLVRDVYQRFINPAASERQIVLLTRVAHRRARRRRARRRQPLPDDSGDGAVGLHDVRRRHHAGAARRARLAARARRRRASIRSPPA